MTLLSTRIGSQARHKLVCALLVAKAAKVLLAKYFRSSATKAYGQTHRLSSDLSVGERSAVRYATLLAFSVVEGEPRAVHLCVSPRVQPPQQLHCVPASCDLELRIGPHLCVRCATRTRLVPANTNSCCYKRRA